MEFNLPILKFKVDTSLSRFSKHKSLRIGLSIESITFKMLQVYCKAAFYELEALKKRNEDIKQKKLSIFNVKL